MSLNFKILKIKAASVLLGESGFLFFCPSCPLAFHWVKLRGGWSWINKIGFFLSPEPVIKEKKSGEWVEIKGSK